MFKSLALVALVSIAAIAPAAANTGELLRSDVYSVCADARAQYANLIGYGDWLEHLPRSATTTMQIRRFRADMARVKRALNANRCW